MRSLISPIIIQRGGDGDGDGDDSKPNLKINNV